MNVCVYGRISAMFRWKNPIPVSNCEPVNSTDQYIFDVLEHVDHAKQRNSLDPVNISTPNSCNIQTSPPQLLTLPWLLWLIPGKRCWQSPGPAVCRPPWPPWFPSPHYTPSPTPESHSSPSAPPPGPHRGYGLRSGAAVGTGNSDF